MVEDEKSGYLGISYDKSLNDLEGHKRICRMHLRQWEAQDELMQLRQASWRVGELRRSNYENVRIVYDKEQGRAREWLPRGAVPDPRLSNKGAAQARRLKSIIYADPPAPDVEPASTEPDDVDAARFQTKLIEHLDKQGRLTKRGSEAFDRCSTTPAFVHLWIDPRKGGKKRMQVLAHPSADMLENSEIDPETGATTDEWVERWVSETGELVNDASQAALVFLPGMCSEVVDGHNLRFLPHNAADIEDAEGCIIARYLTWRQIKRALDPAMVKKIEDEKGLLDKLTEFRPGDDYYLANAIERKVLDSPPNDKDERLILSMVQYRTECPDYTEGLYLWTLGDCVVADADTWVDENSGETLPIPVGQAKQWSNGERGNGYGTTLFDWIGALNERRAEIIARFMTHLDRLEKRTEYLPIGTTIDPRQRSRNGKNRVFIPPGAQPAFERMENFPASAMAGLEFITNEMDDDAMMGRVFSGLESSQVQSGKHANAIVAQSLSSMWEVIDNVRSMHERLWMVTARLAHAFFERTHLTRFANERGGHEERTWSGSDLSTDLTVTVRANTLSMLSPPAKLQMMLMFVQSGLIDLDEGRDFARNNTKPLMGMREDVHDLRVRAQIHAWKQGPPEGFQPASAPQMDDLGQPMLDEQGQPVVTQVMDPITAGVWDPRPVDDAPFVAAKRWRLISELMASSHFVAHPPEWQWGVAQEYMRAMMAAMGALGQVAQPGQPPQAPQSPAQLGQSKGPLPSSDAPSEVDQSGGPDERRRVDGQSSQAVR